MRHAFDSRQSVAFEIRTRHAAICGCPQVSQRSAAGSCPSLSSITLQTEISGQTEGDFEQDDQDSGSGSMENPMLSSIMPEARFFGCTDLRLAEIATEVDECESGQLVTYRIGKGDPNDVIAQAMARGASGIITEQLLPCPLPQCIVGSVDLTLAKITATVCEAPDRQLLTIGILGDSGKTSTCLLAATMTKAMGFRTAYQCDLGSSDGVVGDTSQDSIPTGKQLIEWLAESSDCMSRIALVEIDEKAARDGHYDAIMFDILIVTGKREVAKDFGPCGLECLLDRLTPSGIVIAPGDDRRTMQCLESCETNCVTYSTSAETEFGAIMIDQSGGMSTLMLSSGDTSAMMETPLCGKSMASNLAAAMALGSLLGGSLHEIAKHLSTLRSIPGRGQRLTDFGHATVVVETGGTPQRIASALRTAKQTSMGGRVWCVLSVDEKDSSEMLARVGGIIERGSHHCVVTSRDGAANQFLRRAHEVLDGVKECALMRLVADRDRAIEWAIRSSKPRDTVVIITNETGESASVSRARLSQIESIVQSTRASIEPVEVDAVPEQSGQPIKLKLFR